jgi:hypothetical protein
MKIPLTYGAAMAFASALLTFTLFFTGYHDSVEKMQSGFAQTVAVVVPLLIAVACLALAMREKRSNTPADQTWGYGSAFGVGVLTALFGALFSAIFAYIYFKFLNPGMAEVMYDMQVAKMEQQGLSSQQLEGAEKVMRMMLSPAAMTLFQTFSGFLITVVIALIVAIFFKRRTTLAAEAPPVL